MAADLIEVEILYALPESTRSLHLQLPTGATLGEALDRAAQQVVLDGLDWRGAPVGIFGRIATREQPLNEGDRIEIYRPLAADPKTARRKRVASKSGRS